VSWDDQPVIPFREPLGRGTRLQKGLYVVVRQLGEGSFSLTYAASQRPGQMPVAIKEFFPLGCWRENFQIQVGPPWTAESFAQAIQAFLEEGKILERFDHPGIVKVLGMFRAQGTAYLVEELLEGGTLGQWLQQNGTCSEQQVRQMLAQVGEAVMEIHAAGLVHSDLKPENLYLTNTGRYVILDFGTARSHRADERDRQEVAAVSPGYSPLEQYQKTHRLTPAADVYALAATVYHMLSGFPPPDARDRSQGAQLVPLQAVSLELQEALQGALQLHPLRRTPGVGPFLEQLGLEVSGSANWQTVENFQVIAERTAHLGATTTLALHAPSQLLYSGGRDGRICAWSWPQLHPRLSHSGHQRSPITCMDISSNGSFLVSGAQDGSIKVWSAHERGEPHWLVAAGPAVQRLRFHPTQDHVVAAFSDGLCQLLGPELSCPAWQAHQGAVRGLDIHPKGQIMVTGGLDGTVCLWDWESQALLESFAVSGAVHSLRFTPDGNGLLVASGDHQIGLWDGKSRRLVRALHGHRAEVWEAGFSSESNLLVTASADHCLYGFRADSGRCVHCTQVAEGLTGALALDPVQPLVGTGGSDGSIRVWQF